MQFKCRRPHWSNSLPLALAIVVHASAASARPWGIDNPSCTGCHDDASRDTRVSITAVPNNPGLNAPVMLRVTIAATGIKAGGMYLTASSPDRIPVGVLESVDRTTRRLNEGLTHGTCPDNQQVCSEQTRRPNPAVDGTVTFDFKWTSPGAKSSVVFEASAIGANLSSGDKGDAFGRGRLSLAAGCDGGTEYWADSDGDGVGDDKLDPVRLCGATAGYVANKGDCNDGVATISPRKPELCNGVDDNCDGKVDEGFPSVELYVDTDGDGFGAGTETKTGCGKLPGFGVGSRDCNDQNKDIYPGKAEICNGKDDDCNDRIDNGVLPRCGEGACVREATSCEGAGQCNPGPPKAERCNLLDDDCDGKVDNGDDVCAAGGTCVAGKCTGGGGAGGSDTGGAGGGGTQDEEGSDDEPSGSKSGGCQIGGVGTPPSAIMLALAIAAVVARPRRARRRTR